MSNNQLSLFREVPKSDKLFSEIALRLVGMDGKGEAFSFGTAFVLLPHLLVTARHVIEEFIRRGNRKPNSPEVALTFWAIQIAWKVNEHEYNIWEVTHTFISPHSDIAILKVRAYNDTAAAYTQWKTTQVNLEMPKVGESIIGFGFHSTSFAGSRFNPEGGLEHLELNDKAFSSRGAVKAVYPVRRDSCMLPFPCFEVDARFDHGMSGGLVINSQSELFGIICCGMNTDYSHAAMLWPMMGIVVDFDTFRTSPIEGCQPLLEFARLGFWKPRGWQKIRLTSPQDGLPAVTYLA